MASPNSSKQKRRLRGTKVTDKTNTANIKKLIPYK